MKNFEFEYIELCKKQIEEKFSYGNALKFSQKDLGQLSQSIEDKTNVYISLSTLKRIWKNDFKQGPQLATLNALVSILGYKNWQDFKLQNAADFHSVANDKVPSKTKQIKILKNVLFASAVIVVIGLMVTSFSKTRKTILINQPISFSADKTLMRSVPNTVIFNYDVSNIIADSFFIQQSWNKWRRNKIDPTQNVYSSLYYESGYHRAKLIANDSIIAMLPIHILSDGWEPHIYYKESDDRYIDFKNESIEENGQLHLPLNLLEKKGVDISKDFYTRITNSRDFNVHSDDFHFKTRMKLDPFTSSNCPWLILHIITEKHIFYVKLVRKGCEVYGTYKLGEIVRNGKTTNLKGLGQDINEWQEVDILIKNRNAVLKINEEVIYTESYEEDYGKIMGLSFIFDGKGSVDHVYMSDLKKSNVFDEEFDNN